MTSEREDFQNKMKKVSFSSKAAEFFKGKGFLLVLMLSVAAIGAATYFAYSQTIERLTQSDVPAVTSQNVWVFSDDLNVDKPQPDVPKDVETAEEAAVTDAQTAEEADADITAEAEEANKPVASTSPNMLPVEGETLNPFSNGELVKSLTLGVWKTHDGVDIAAAEGTPVKSMSDGVVKEVKEDALWGVCVIVDQSNGLEAHYCGLAPDVSVKQGQEIAAGEIIGKVGKTAEIEIAEEPHLHFGVKQNGAWIDPMSVITTEENR